MRPLFSVFLVALVTGTVSTHAGLLHKLGIHPPNPIPEHEPGDIYPPGDPGAKVILEAFVDILCSDSMKAFPELVKVAQHYSGGDVAVKIHQLTFPYFRWSDACTKAFYQVRDKDHTNMWTFFAAILNNNAAYSNAATMSDSEQDIRRRLATVVANSTHIEPRAFLRDFDQYSAITEWKYGVSRGVAGTPWYFLNGVSLGVPPGDLIDFDTWRSLIDPMLGGSDVTTTPFLASTKASVQHGEHNVGYDKTAESRRQSRTERQKKKMSRSKIHNQTRRNRTQSPMDVHSMHLR